VIRHGIMIRYMRDYKHKHCSTWSIMDWTCFARDCLSWSE